MRTRIAFAATLIAACSVALPVQAAPPEGKGPGNNASNAGQGGNGGKGNTQASGNPGKGNSGKGNSGKERSNSGNAGSRGPDMRGNYDSGRHYDDRGRHYDYFDDRRDRRGHVHGDALLGDLVYAGISAALAREYALDYGFGGYSALPPGIRKNLARGKPLPPGIAKKMVPGSMLGRLPRHPGYEWRIAGTDLILVSVATAVVADILYDVFD